MAKPELRITLRRPLERVVAHGHPWLYRDALEPFQARPGTVVTVLDRRGRFLARGLAEEGPIGVRVYTLRDEPLELGLLARRILEALALRDRILPPRTDTLRLIHGEGDRLPGLVCDRYAHTAVLRFDGEAALAWRDTWLEALRGPLAQRGIDTLFVRTGRGEKKQVERIWGQTPEMPMQVQEHGMILLADLLRGQKTGLFLDHRESRLVVRQLSQASRVLNLYGYTGGFSIAAGLGGASWTVTVDSAAPALALAVEGWRRNGLDPRTHRAEAADVEAFLSAGGEEAFDLIVADPPSFAPNAETVSRALKAYRRIHEGVLGRLAPGGWYLAASCSSHVDRAAFETTLREAAHARRRPLQVCGRWGAGPDHPVPLGFPEGDYLKVVLARAL